MTDNDVIDELKAALDAAQPALLAGRVAKAARAKAEKTGEPADIEAAIRAQEISKKVLFAPTDIQGSA